MSSVSGLRTTYCSLAVEITISLSWTAFPSEGVTDRPDTGGEEGNSTIMYVGAVPVIWVFESYTLVMR
jgi:hypothetical protein